MVQILATKLKFIKFGPRRFRLTKQDKKNMKKAVNVLSIDLYFKPLFNQVFLKPLSFIEKPHLKIINIQSENDTYLMYSYRSQLYK